MNQNLLTLFLFLGLSWQILFAHTIAEENFTCPIDGQQWRQSVDASGTSWGQRLDFKPLGPIAAPWTLPQCPKCRFVIYDEPAKIPIDKLKPYILSKAYRTASKDQPTYACLALIQTFLKAAPQAIGDAYLKASWQAETKPVECRKYMKSALTQFLIALPTLKLGSPEWEVTALLCCELERRTEQFKAASDRCEALLQSEAQKTTPAFQQALKRELKFIAKKDSKPHAIVAEQEELLKSDQD